MGRTKSQSAPASLKPPCGGTILWTPLDRWWGKSLAMLATVALLSLAYQPVGQFYLAWIAMVPWLLTIAHCRSLRAVFAFSWLGGTAFYWANMWWLYRLTGPGAFALLFYIAIYWGLTALLAAFHLRRPASDPTQPPPPAGKLARLHSLLISPAAAIIFIPAAWAALEFLRGYVLWGGLPFLYLAHSQSNALIVCQIADTTGQLGVSFWVMTLNVLIALILLRGLRPLRVASILTGGLTLIVVAYGIWRLNENSLYDGPRLVILQSNYPQSNDGQKGASANEILTWHAEQTRHAAGKVADANPPADLVVWSETMLPAINDEFRDFLTSQIDIARRLLLQPDADPNLQKQYDQIRTSLDSINDARAAIRDLARKHDVAILAGGMFLGPREENREIAYTDRRNSAYFVPAGGDAPIQRYDKIHLVPFGEFLPFKESWPLGYRFLNLFNPYGYDYNLTPGTEASVTIFSLHDDRPAPTRFVAPICFEDLDAPLIARMFRPRQPGGQKSADFLVNLTNDGWFIANENALHLQGAVFRSIENRVPAARSVNTGMSAVIDPVGRTITLPPRTEGTLRAALKLDHRTSFYTRYGDLFSGICIIASMGVLCVRIAHARAKRAESA